MTERSEQVRDLVNAKRTHLGYRVVVTRVRRTTHLAGIPFPDHIEAWFAWVECTVDHGVGHPQCQWVDLVCFFPDGRHTVILESEFTRTPWPFEEGVRAMMGRLAQRSEL